MMQQREEFEAKTQQLQIEAADARLREEQVRDTLEAEIAELAGRAPAANKQLADENMRHGEQLALAQLSLLEEREKALVAQQKLDLMEEQLKGPGRPTEA